MMDICYGCGELRADKTIDPSGPYAICPVCSHRHPFRQLPLLVVGGASGTGKTAVGQVLLGTLEEAIVLEGDLLWSEAFNTPRDGYRMFYDTWLRLARNISQAGKPVVLLNAGAAIPGSLEPSVQRRYFTRIHYCALVCDEAEMIGRLKRRPAWRNSADPGFLERNAAFNAWLKANAETSSPPIALLDTTDGSPARTAEKVREWIRSSLEAERPRQYYRRG